MGKIKLTVSIVNYNAGEYLNRCLDSIKKVEDEVDDLDVVVVDNASEDDSVALAKKHHPNVKFIINVDNVGFGKAHNQVLEKIDDGYVLILNPDVELFPGVLKAGIEYLENHTDTGAYTCEIELSNGKIDLTAHRGFPTPLASFLYLLGNDRLYHLTNKNLKEVHEVDAITGAFLLTTSEVLNKVGTFDEDYFMYAEDIDLCYRIKKASYKVIYDPTKKVIHHKGISTGLKKHSQEQTTASLKTRQRSLDAFYKTMKTFYKKHYWNEYPYIISFLVFLGIDLRWWLARKKLTV